MDKISFEALLKEEAGEEKVNMENVTACIERLVKENLRLLTEFNETKAREAKRYEELKRESSLEIMELKHALKEQGALASGQEEITCKNIKKTLCYEESDEILSVEVSLDNISSQNFFKFTESFQS